MIFREAAICHHCNTIQDGVDLVQASTETASAVSTSQGNQKKRNHRVILLFVCAVILIVLGVAFAAWFMQKAQ